MSHQNTKSSFLAAIAFFLTWLSFASAVPSITVSSSQDVDYEVGDFGQFSLILSEKVPFPVYVNFTYSPVKDYNIDPLIDSEFKNETIGPILFNTTSFTAGHTIIKVNALPKEIKTTDAFVRVSVYKMSALNVASSVIGWFYFVCWSISFYPQIIANRRRKSVVGLNFDFLGLNLTGFIAYSIYNIGFKFVDVVQSEYQESNPGSIIPVQINDVVFAVHAVFATAVTIGQCFIYQRGNQLIAKTTVAALALVWSTAGVFLLITALGLNKTTPWLTYLYFFSYVKLIVTLTKYIPQVVYNYKRKSTTGWSIGTVLLDFIGGIFSIAQMFMDAYNYNDWHSIFGNFTKFGLGAASVTFDVIFMVQHYGLYRNRRSSKSDSMSSVLVSD